MTTNPACAAECAEIERYLTTPRAPNTDLRAQVDRAIKADLGMRIQCNQWFSPDSCDLWDFAYSETDENVPAVSAGSPLKATAARWIYRVVLSHRGPLVTCETLSLVPERPDSWHDSKWRYDDPPRTKAVQWTQHIARQLALRYVDAKTLRNWEVSYEQVDPEFDLEHNVLAVPSAFEVLFYE